MGAIQRQGLINTLIIYAGVLLGFINSIIIQPNLITPEEVGLVKIFISFGGLLSAFLLLGGSNMTVRFFPMFKDREKRHHGFLGFTLLFPIVGIMIGGIIFYSIYSWLVSHYTKDSLLFAQHFEWAFPLGAVMTLGIVLNAYSSSNLKTVIPSFFSDVWVRVLLIIITIVYSMRLVNLETFIELIFLIYVSQLVCMIIYVYIVDRPGLKVDWVYVNKIGFSNISKYALLLALTGLSSLSLKFLDNVMIGAYMNLSFVGVYSIGAFIAQFIETPLSSLERVANVKISHAFKENNMNEIKEIYYRSVRYLFLFGGLLVACIVTNIYDFLKLLPLAYQGAAGVTIIMSFGSIINMATGINSPIINNSSKYAWNFIFLFVLLISTITFNVMLIPKFGIIGTAIATGMSSTLFNLMKFIFIWRNFKMQPYDLHSLKTIFIIIACVFAGLSIPVPVEPVFAILVRGTIVTFIFIMLTRLSNIVPEFHKYLNVRSWTTRK